MLTQDRKNVYCIKNFTTDKTLRKYTEKDFSTLRNEVVDTDINSYIQDEFSNLRFSTPDGSVNIDFGNQKIDTWKNVWDGLPFGEDRSYSGNFGKIWLKTKLYTKSLFFKGRESPIVFFKKVKTSISELDKIEEKIEYLDKVSQQLRVSKQVKMLNVAIYQRTILEYEKILKDNGFKQYITEENLIKFTLKCKKGLRVDFIKDFNRIIPETVIKNRDRVEDLKVFDNYIILHYDPDMKNVSLVEKKDPILFGLIKNSNRLYFIDDWIDEKCDLTYNKIIQELDIDEQIV